MTTNPDTAESTKYRVRVVGPIWQPGIIAAGEVTVTEPMEYPRAEGESDAEYELRMVQCAAVHQLGDFSGIDAWDVLRVTVPRNDIHTTNQTATYRRVVEHRVTNYTFLVAFTDDEEMAWCDAMFGSVDA